MVVSNTSIGQAAWDIWKSYPDWFQNQIIEAFCEGALFQLSQIKIDPKWKYVENFNREYARCKYNLAYSNTISPIVHEEVFKRGYGPPAPQVGLGI